MTHESKGVTIVEYYDIMWEWESYKCVLCAFYLL